MKEKMPTIILVLTFYLTCLNGQELNYDQDIGEAEPHYVQKHHSDDTEQFENFENKESSKNIEQDSNLNSLAELLPNIKEIEGVLEFNKSAVHRIQKRAASCGFTCPAGKRKVPNPMYNAAPNGCGPKGISIDWTLPNQCKNSISNCCNAHDICWGKCGASRDNCDNAFKTCLKNIGGVTDLKGAIKCTLSINALYGLLRAPGCVVFDRVQSQACKCV